MKQFITNRRSLRIILLTITIFGFSSRKNTASSQNFSARYNFLFNANELLAEYEHDYSSNPDENFGSILPVFISHPLKPAVMDKVIKKAGTIIAEKGNSSYLALAHLLMAKAHFNNEDYFTAIGYANDVLTAYSTETEINDEALLIKTRALFGIEDYEAAYPLAILLGAKASGIQKNQSYAYAAAAQAYIFNKEWNSAINHLHSALKCSATAEEKTRMRFVIAQLLEKINRPFEALEMYRTVRKSNASYELKLNAAFKEITLSPSSFIPNQAIPEPLKRMLKKDIYIDYKDQILYAMAGYEKKAALYASATAHYLEAAKINGTNKVLTSMAYATAADIQLRERSAYTEAALNYQAAIEALPRTSANYVEIKNKLKYSKEISNLYIILNKTDTLKKHIETPPYNKTIIKGYYEIATLYLQNIQDSLQAEKVYNQINSRFPDNHMHQSIAYALSILRSGSSAIQPNNSLAGNAFLLKRHQDELSATMESISSMNRDRNMQLIRTASLYDQPDFFVQPSAIPVTSNLTAVPESKPLAKNMITTNPQVTLQKTALSYTTEPPVTTAVAFTHNNESVTYYFMIAVEDAALNMSPSRFGIGEFNRSRYAEQNLKHRLLEFEQTQVIYVGTFSSVEDARKYAVAIAPQLKSIMKTDGKKYTTAIISKENLEKLESDEIYKVYQDFSKQ